MACRQIDHTGDVGLEVEAPTLEALAAEAARGLTAILVHDPSAIRAQRETVLRVEGREPDLLLRALLAEVLYRHLANGDAYATFAVGCAPDAWTARCLGETFDPARHGRGTELKAVTYHQLEVRRMGDGWFARVIFDV